MKLFLWLVLAAATVLAQTKTGKTLDMYVVDTEGGHSVLYVSPTGETLMMDVGNPGTRDTDRIMEAINTAGVKQIDHLILTHYHVDHVGGLAELAKRIPIKHFIDHGASVEAREQVQGFQAMYAEMNAKSHMVAKPGDKIPFGGADVTVVASNAQVIKKALPGGGIPNAACASFKPRDESRVFDPENAYSVGVAITLGKFRTINLGDLTWNKENELMCPSNPIGHVSLYLTSHHGIEQSGSAVLVHGLSPQVAIMHNSTRKGGVLQTMDVLHSSRGLEDIWQLHWAYAAGMEHNTPGLFIANVEEPATLAAQLTAPQGGGRGPGGPPAGGPPPAGATPQPGTPTVGAPTVGGPIAGGPPAGGRGPGGFGGGRGGGHTGLAFYIKVSANADGSFTVTNSRNSFSKTYQPR